MQVLLVYHQAYVVLVTVEDGASSLISTIFPWLSRLELNSMSQSSGPSLMRHCRQHIGESNGFTRKRRTYNDDLDSDKEDDYQFHPRGRCLLQHEVPMIRVPV